jgi:hypothetical protein
VYIILWLTEKFKKYVRSKIITKEIRKEERVKAPYLTRRPMSPLNFSFLCGLRAIRERNFNSK